MVPLCEIVAFCGLLAVTPAGSSNWIDQPVIALLLELLTTNLPWFPFRLNTAVRPVAA